MSKLVQLVFAGMALLVSSLSFAHPGHDHSATSSSLMHALFYVSIFALLATGVYLVKKNSKKASDTSSKENEL